MCEGKAVYNVPMKSQVFVAVFNRLSPIKKQIEISR